MRWIVFPVLLLISIPLVSGILAEGSLHPIRRGSANESASEARDIATSCKASVSSASVVGKDGVSLQGWWLKPAVSSGRAVVICHGIADSSMSSLWFAPMFLKHGYAVLVPDGRGQGRSAGFVTYGVLESTDLLEWTRWIGKQGGGPSRIFGLGESLGGAVLLQSLSSGAPFRAIVAECPYSSFEAIAQERVTKRLHLALLSKAVVQSGILSVQWLHSVDLRQANTEAAVARARIPMLLIHGMKDTATSPENSERLLNSNPKRVELWLVPNAGHVGAYSAGPAEFERRVLECFDGAK